MSDVGRIGYWRGFRAAQRAGRDRAAVEMAKMPPDDGTVSVSVPDATKIERQHFKLCRTCGWARGKLGDQPDSPVGPCRCPT